MKATIIKTEGIVQGTDFMRYGKNRAYFKTRKGGNVNASIYIQPVYNSGATIKIKLYGGVFESGYNTTSGTETEKLITTNSGYSGFISPNTELIEIDNITQLGNLNIKNTYGAGLYSKDENSAGQLYQCHNLSKCESDLLAGDVTEILKNNQALAYIQFLNTKDKVYGDLSYIGDLVESIMANRRLSFFTWSGNKHCTSTFSCKSISFVDSESIDRFLNDMASLPVRGTTINIWGTRTAASDTAVQTLVANGISLYINGTQITNE